MRPVDLNLPTVSKAVSQAKIDLPLIRNAGFIGHAID
jgi:hypothetical protein